MAAMLSSADWATLMRSLDEALELPPAERPAWLAAMTQHSATARAKLSELLADPQAVEAADFLGMLQPLSTDAACSARTGDHVAGDAVAPYRLIEPIGHGGMGSVWLAKRADAAVVGKWRSNCHTVAFTVPCSQRRLAHEGRILLRSNTPTSPGSTTPG